MKLQKLSVVNINCIILPDMAYLSILKNNLNQPTVKTPACLSETPEYKHDM